MRVKPQIMQRLTFSSLSLDELQRWVNLQEGDTGPHPWTTVAEIALMDDQQ